MIVPAYQDKLLSILKGQVGASADVYEGGYMPDPGTFNVDEVALKGKVLIQLTNTILTDELTNPLTVTTELRVIWEEAIDVNALDLSGALKAANEQTFDSNGTTYQLNFNTYEEELVAPTSEEELKARRSMLVRVEFYLIK